MNRKIVFIDNCAHCPHSEKFDDKPLKFDSWEGKSWECLKTEPEADVTGYVKGDVIPNFCFLEDARNYKKSKNKK